MRAGPRPARLTTQYLTLPDADASAFLGSRPTWLWGCEHGVNEHGVTIGNEKIFTVDSPRPLPPALLGMDVVRLVLERARTADDALDLCTSLVETYGQGGSGEPFDDEPVLLFVPARRCPRRVGRRDEQPHLGGEARRRRHIDLEPGEPVNGLDARRRAMSRRARTSTSGACLRCRPQRADHRLAVTRTCVARGPARRRARSRR